MIKLRPRLQMVADMVRTNVTLADIGTDHAYLPAYLIQSGKVHKAYACDLREHPLENAKQTLVRYNLEDKVCLQISDGLDAFKTQCAEDIVLAGMGGLLIVDILSRCDWLKSTIINLVLQPMAHVEDVRKYLVNNGFEIIRENATIDSGKLYVAINAYYTNNTYKDYPESFYYIGKLGECKSKYAKEYLMSQKSRLQRRADAIKNIDECEAEKLYSIIEDIERCYDNGNC